MDWLGEQLNIKDMSNWYKVSSKVTENIKLKTYIFQDVRNFEGGYSILSRYNNSIYQILSTVYPNYNWKPSEYSRFPIHHWEDVSNQREFMDSIYKELDLKDMNDWYNVTTNVSHYSYTIILNRNSKLEN